MPTPGPCSATSRRCGMARRRGSRFILDCPPATPRDVIAFDWVWELEASPRQLWPHRLQHRASEPRARPARAEVHDAGRPGRGRGTLRRVPQGRPVRVARASLRVDRRPAVRGLERVPERGVSLVPQPGGARAAERRRNPAGPANSRRAAGTGRDGSWPTSNWAGAAAGRWRTSIVGSTRP